MKKKKITLQKKSLMNLQDDQMKSLIGAEEMSNDSGATCDATIKLPAVDESCCRRSC